MRVSIRFSSLWKAEEILRALDSEEALLLPCELAEGFLGIL
jgi:hypothetical protein